ncbi:MAG: hypothetical protein Q9227_000868 [Pyrenula ochraceoflavens]
MPDSAGLCRRRHWPDPLYESYYSASGAGYRCVVRVNNREYQTDTYYESEKLARENAAMRAYLICRNFSVNDGMYPVGHDHGGVVQGIPVAIGTGRYRYPDTDGSGSSGSRSGGSSPESRDGRKYIYSHRTLYRTLRLKTSSSSFSSQLFRNCPDSREFPLYRRSPKAALASTKIQARFIASDAGASNIDHQSFDGKEEGFENVLAEEREKQVRTPWHREGTAEAPVKRPRSAGAMTKGKLLTTPSRLLKLVLPLTTVDHNTDRKDIQPLALLVHPQQPLSYLERLIQSELPSISTEKGDGRIPKVSFRAVESKDDEIKPREETSDKQEKGTSESRSAQARPGDGNVESYSGLGRQGQKSRDNQFVRWSNSTEIGDFIRDAARAKEFAVEVEGAPDAILVGVPSFSDRTHYLRSRLRKVTGQIVDLSALKRECDIAAHKGGQRMALGGFGVMLCWWFTVYKLTFTTDLGWDTMEPVTYLVGLTAAIGGYGWFLYHNREVSYRSALNITISRRQNKLYEAKGFDLNRWESLVDEANALRKEIKAVASEYDVDWNEAADEHGEEIANTLRKERQKEEKSSKKSSRKDEDEND